MGSRPGAVLAAAVFGYVHAALGLYFTASAALFQYPREIAGTTMFQMTLLAQFTGLVLLVLGAVFLQAQVTRVVFVLAAGVGMPTTGVLYVLQDVLLGLIALLLLTVLPLIGLILVNTRPVRYWFSGGR